MKFHKFKELCSECWNENFGFITIDMTRKSIMMENIVTKLNHF
jgi:hypothetical protein